MTSNSMPLTEAELRRLLPRLARVVEVSLLLNSTLDLKRVLQIIIEAATSLVESEAASILLFDEKTRELRFISAAGSDSDELAQLPVPIDRSVAGSIFTSNRPLILNDAQNDPRIFRQVGEKMQFETRQLLGVPMRSRGRVTGVLEAINKRQGEFDETDAQMLSIVASQAAVAVNNARLLKDLQRANEELGQTSKIQGDFIARASHELRTPLLHALGYAALFQEDLKGEMAEPAQALYKAVSRMQTIVEEMTSASYLQGKHDIKLARLDLSYLAREQCQDLIKRATAKGQEFVVAPSAEPTPVDVDPARMLAALTHLIDNAVRFTPERGRLVVTTERRGTEAWLRVADNGIGIESDKLEKVFAEFYQVEDPLTRRHGGLGLGLSIVRGIAKEHGGRVWAESPGLGRGATFTFALPLAAQAA